MSLHQLRDFCLCTSAPTEKWGACSITAITPSPVSWQTPYDYFPRQLGWNLCGHVQRAAAKPEVYWFKTNSLGRHISQFVGLAPHWHLSIVLCLEESRNNRCRDREHCSAHTIGRRSPRRVRLDRITGLQTLEGNDRVCPRHLKDDAHTY